ncbi:MAG: choice-of-anchor E domain-containing protein, partial [Candidatus Cloacimonetes bacterium]|nr:choice-of-anchor E domain-containing protein [Candidatus Cloacimonadota bacterium]
MKYSLTFLLFFTIFLAGNLFAATQVQQVNITDDTSNQTITFNYFNSSLGTLTGVTVELYATTTGGYHHADNDGQSAAYPVEIFLGATFNLHDETTAPRLLNPSFADVWLTQTADSHEDSLAADDGDGATFDTSPPDGVQWFATGSSDTVTDNIHSLFISGYVGSGTFNYILYKSDYLHIEATGGDIDGQYSGSDLGGYVKLTYIYDEPLAVELSTFAAYY